MKFARRAEGIKSARTIFKKAREDPRSKYHVYVSAALIEYYCSKDQNIAFRIFELGLKKFPEDAEYTLCYLDYLSHLNGKEAAQKNNNFEYFKCLGLQIRIPPNQTVVFHY